MAKNDYKKQQELERQQREDRARYQQLADSASKPSELQQRLEGEDLNFINWESGKGDYAGKPIDVMQAPGLGTARSLYEHAKAGQVGERQGQGLLTMGEAASSPEYAANVGEQRRLRREQDAAGNLENAVAQKSAEVHGTAVPLINLSQSRALSLADMAGGQSRFSTGNWTNFRPRSRWDALGQIAKGAVAAAPMFA